MFCNIITSDKYCQRIFVHWLKGEGGWAGCGWIIYVFIPGTRF